MHNFPNRFSLRSLSRTRCSRHGAIAHLSLPSLLLARGRHHPFDEQSMHKNGAKNFFTFPMCLAANYTRAGFRQTARARVSPSFLVCAEKRPLAKDSVVSPRLPRRGLVQGTFLLHPQVEVSSVAGFGKVGSSCFLCVCAKVNERHISVRAHTVEGKSCCVGLVYARFQVHLPVEVHSLRAGTVKGTLQGTRTLHHAKFFRPLRFPRYPQLPEVLQVRSSGGAVGKSFLKEVPVVGKEKAGASKPKGRRLWGSFCLFRLCGNDVLHSSTRGGPSLLVSFEGFLRCCLLLFGQLSSGDVLKHPISFLPPNIVSHLLSATSTRNGSKFFD